MLPDNRIVQPAPEQSVIAAFSVRTKDSFLELGPDWDDLLGRTNSPTIFLSHDWMAEWWDLWGASHELLVIALRGDAGRLIAIAPFYIRQPKWRSTGCRVLAFMASTGVASDHLDLLIEPGSEVVAVKEIVRLLLAERKRWDYIELADGDLESALLCELRRQLHQTGLLQYFAPSVMLPYASLPGSFGEYLNRIGPSVRYNFRRRLRQLKEAGPVEFLCLTNSSDIRARFDDLIQLHRQRFDHIGKISAFLDPRLQAFHLGLLNRLADSPWPRLYLLIVGGRTVAALFGFAVGDRFSFYQSGMDPAWSRYSVGLVLLGCSIQHCIDSGQNEFDFLRGTQAYKLLWATECRQGIVVRFFDARPKSFAAMVSFGLYQCAARLKATLRRFRSISFGTNRRQSVAS